MYECSCTLVNIEYNIALGHIVKKNYSFGTELNLYQLTINTLQSKECNHPAIIGYLN